jgi:hypothetical protein
MATERNPTNFDWADDMAVSFIATVHGYPYVRAARAIAQYLRDFRSRIEAASHETQTNGDGGCGAGVQHRLPVANLPELVLEVKEPGR